MIREYFVIDASAKDQFKIKAGCENFEPVQLKSGQWVIPTSVVNSENFPEKLKVELLKNQKSAALKRLDFKWTEGKSEVREWPKEKEKVLSVPADSADIDQPLRNI